MRTTLPRSQWHEQPWKNGGGVTHEIVRWPDTGEYDVRVSIAEVARSGPFSTFPGYQRWSIVLAGDLGLVETARGHTHRLAIGEPFQLAGETAVTAQLTAPAALLNILVKPGWLVGIGATTRHAVFEFDLVTHQAHRIDPAATVDGATMVWIARARLF
ncbi:MAG: HutD family protein [Kofleriaceae bacterium]